MSPDSLRLFVAAAVPVEHLERIRDELAPLRQRWPSARWTDVANQHITLKFLGSVEAMALDEIEEACRGVAAQADPAELRLAGLGAFPRTARANVLWVGVDDAAGLLPSLARGLDAALGPLGFPLEKRGFSAHLTVARFRSPQRVEPLPPLAPSEPFRLDAMGLWRSHLSSKGARYELVAACPLGDSAT